LTVLSQRFVAMEEHGGDEGKATAEFL
jgi:hypothetical protein